MKDSVNSDRAGACTIPDSGEEQWETLHSTTPGSALRVCVLPGRGGHVRLQQLELVKGLGWTVQKSLVIPGELLPALIPQLRKADCLMPRRIERAGKRAWLRLTPAEPRTSPKRC